MSEEAGQADATELAGRYADLMHVGDQDDNRKHATGQAAPNAQTDAERQYNASVFGQTFRERFGRERGDPGVCIVLCASPNGHRFKRCPSCYGRAVPAPVYLARLDPMPGRAARFAGWAGGVIGTAAASFAEAVMFPFRVGRAHTEAMVRDILQEAMSAGLTAEVDGLSDILTVSEAIEEELRAIRNAVERAEEAH